MSEDAENEKLREREWARRKAADEIKVELAATLLGVHATELRPFAELLKRQYGYGLNLEDGDGMITVAQIIAKAHKDAGFQYNKELLLYATAYQIPAGQGWTVSIPVQRQAQVDALKRLVTMNEDMLKAGNDLVKNLPPDDPLVVAWDKAVDKRSTHGY